MPLSIEGKDYMIQGIGEIRLFPIGKISQALTDADCPRDTQTIRSWEKKGVLPPSIFRGGGKRLFSKEQIDCIVRVAVECQIKQGKNVTVTNFVERIWEEMQPINEEYKRRLSNENIKES